MNEKGRAGLAVTCGCLFFILLRALSPAFFQSYDWISLALTALAAAGILLPALLPGGRAAEPGACQALPTEALVSRFQNLGWGKPGGGIYDSLPRQAERDGYAAVCGGYATLVMLLDQHQPGLPSSEAIARLQDRGSLEAEEAEALEELMAILKVCMRRGESGLDPDAAPVLLDLCLRALSRLEHI